MKAKLRGSIAALMAVALVSGAALPTGSVSGIPSDISITASAFEPDSVYIENGILHLSGSVTRLMISQYSSDRGIYAVVADPGTILPGDCSGLFAEFSYVKAFDLSRAEAIDVVEMSEMFRGCYNAEVIDLGNMNTRYVQSMRGMFLGCSSLETIDLSGFNTIDVEDMSNMFSGCSSLKSLDLKSFDTRNVTGMSYMFYNCHALEDLDIRTFNTSSVVTIDNMFCGCYSLTELNLYCFSTYRFINMNRMFGDCGNLSKIYVGESWYSIPDSEDIFVGCTSLVGGSGTAYDYERTGSSYARIDDGPANPGYFTRYENECCSFEPYTGTLILSGFIDHSRLHEYANNHSVRTIIAEEGTILPNDCSELFRNFQAESIDLSKAYSSNVTSTYGMFRHCNNLTSLDLSGFDTSSVRVMASMFEGCYNLLELDLSSFDTHNVDMMSYMFASCQSLNAITVGNLWNTERLVSHSNAMYMFLGCDSLVGGAGTKYNDAINDSTYAHIDSADNPGYLSVPKLGFRTNSMTLGGSISLNFYVALNDVPDDLLDQCFVEFTVNGKKQKSMLDRSKMNKSKTAYGFTCMLNSVSMADKINATLTYFTPDGIEKTMTTVSTAETYLNKFSTNDEEKTWNLIRSINDYGYYMQQYLAANSVSPWRLCINHRIMGKEILEPSYFTGNSLQYLSELEGMQRNFGSNKNIEKVNYSLSLDSDTALNFKFKKADGYNGKFSVTVDGKTVKPKKLTDGRLQVTIANIPAHKLNTMHTVVVTTDSGKTTYTASALSYVYECISLPLNELEFNAMCAMYEYYKAAVAFRKP